MHEKKWPRQGGVNFYLKIQLHSCLRRIKFGTVFMDLLINFVLKNFGIFVLPSDDISSIH